MANKRRLIDADELRRRILAFATGLHSEVLPVDTVIMLLTQMQDVDPVRQWIPVKERMPETDDMVLVTASGKPQANITLDAAYELASYNPDEGWIFDMWPDWEDANVTHWMPLPEAPKEV